MAQYVVKSGDTLSAIARKLGVSIDKISGYRSGDPNLIYPGETLTIGEAPAGSLKGTMTGTEETGGGVDVTKPKELPTIPADNLSVFSDLLKRVSERYGREGMATGMKAGMGALGVAPEQISGKGLAGIVDFVKEQATPEIADIYKSTVDLLESSRQSAEKQLTLLISQKALPNLSDEQLANLSGMSGVDFEYLAGIKATQEAEAEEPESFTIVEEGGRKVRLGFDKMGNMISRIDIGEGKDGGDSDQDKRDEEFEKYVKDLAEKIINRDLNREEAKNMIKVFYPEYDENVIYDLIADKPAD